MPDLTVNLSSQDHAAVVSASDADGISPEVWSARAVHRALVARQQSHLERVRHAEDEDAVSPGRAD